MIFGYFFENTQNLTLKKKSIVGGFGIGTSFNY